MILYFDNGETVREISKVKDEKEAFKKINDFCNERNYKIYYIRTWKQLNKNINPKGIECKVFDVGCHFQFFYLTE